MIPAFRIIQIEDVDAMMNGNDACMNHAIDSMTVNGNSPESITNNTFHNTRMMTVKSFTLIATFFLTMMMAAPLAAQTTGSSSIGGLYNYLGSQGSYKVERKSADELSIRTLSNGAELCHVRLTAPHAMMLSASIARLDKTTPVVVNEVVRMINFFNFRSHVGTMAYDAATRTVAMEHYLNPQMLTTEAVAGVVVEFGRTVENEGRRFADMMRK
jgi:hypothetical protein